MDDAGLHAANLAALQLLLARAGGWPHERGDGWVAADAAVAARFFSFTVLTRDGAAPTPTVYAGRSGPAGWVEMDLWGRPAPGEVRHPVLMRREPATLPTDPRVVVARTADQLRTAEQALAAGLEQPELAGERLLGAALLDAPVACAYAPAVDPAAIAALPSRPALLTATTIGRPVYERLGFRVVGRATMRLRERPRPASSAP